MLTDSPLVAFIATTNLERAHAFYGHRLGLRRVEASAYANAYDASGTQLRVTLVDRLVPAAYTVLGWNVAQIHDAVAGLRSRGIVFERYDNLDQDDAGVWVAPSGAAVAWFRDHDGNVLSLTQSPDESRAA